MNDKLLNLRLHQAGDLVDFFMCDPDKWQVCFFDFSFQQKLPSFFAYKTRDFPGYIVEDYFYGSGDVVQESTSINGDDENRTSNMNSMVFPS